MAFVIKQPDLSRRGVKQAMASRIVFGDENTAITIGGEALPANTVVHDVFRHVTAAFNDSGTDTLIVGDAGDPNRHCTTGQTTMDAQSSAIASALATAGGFYYNTATAVTAMYEGQNNDASAGSVDVWVWFTIL